jgi:hypothetical protein
MGISIGVYCTLIIGLIRQYSIGQLIKGLIRCKNLSFIVKDLNMLPFDKNKMLNDALINKSYCSMNTQV